MPKFSLKNLDSIENWKDASRGGVSEELAEAMV